MKKFRLPLFIAATALLAVSFALANQVQTSQPSSSQSSGSAQASGTAQASGSAQAGGRAGGSSSISQGSFGTGTSDGKAITLNLANNVVYIVEFSTNGKRIDAATMQKMQNAQDAYASKLAKSGQLIFSGYADDRTTPMMLLSVTREDDAVQIAQGSPMAQSGMEAKVRDLTITQFGGARREGPNSAASLGGTRPPR